MVIQDTPKSIAQVRGQHFQQCFWYLSEQQSHTNRRSDERIIIEDSIVPQIVKNFPAFYGTRKFVNLFT